MPLNIFILEDDQRFQKMVEIRLKGWRQDLQITSAPTISGALEVLATATQQFDLAILDQHLPDGTGTEISEHPALEKAAILAVSADNAPELPAETVKAGAQHFLGKRQVSEPLFIPLVEALLERKKFEIELMRAKIEQSRFDTIKVLLATLRHEINNPLGAVLGGTYLIRSVGELDEEQVEALQLVEASGKRIKHALDQLCKTAELEAVNKANEKVFHVPGDPAWEQSQ